MKKVEILSWSKNRKECGFRLNLIDHVDVFVYISATTFIVDNSEEELFINIIEYADKHEYTTNENKVIGKDFTHVNKCEIIGSKKAMKEFQMHLGYSSIGNDASETQRINDLCDSISDLRYTICMLEYKIQNIKKYED